MSTIKIINIIEIISLAIIVAFFFIFAANFFNNLFFQSTILSGQFIGAFMGALFAFLFVRLGDGLTRFYKRKLKNYNALVKLERQINIYLNVISDNIFIIDDFTDYIKEIINNDKPVIYFNVLHEFLIDKDNSLDLSNLDLINKVFSFEMGIEKMNHSIVSTNRFYSDIKIAFIEKNIDFNTYKKNIFSLKSKLSELKKFLVGLEQESKELGAMTRLLMREKPLLTKLTYLFIRKRISEKIKKEIPKEVEKLEDEIKNTKKESEEKILAILKKEIR